MDDFQCDPHKIHPIRRLADGLSPLPRVTDLPETQLQLLKVPLLASLMQRVFILIAKPGDGLPQTDDPRQAEEPQDQEQNSPKNE